MVDFEIELRPHVGQYRDKRLGVREVVFPQDLLMYHDAQVEEAQRNYWLQIGYVGHQTDTIEFLPQALGLGQDLLTAVTARVSEMTGRPRRMNLPPRPVGKQSSKPVRDLDAD